MDEKIWRCDCGWGHYLSINRLDDERWLTVDGSFQATNLKEKLRATYEIFRRGHYDTWLGLTLTPETTKEIRDHLTELLDEH
jgi:hypothetical protein